MDTARVSTGWVNGPSVCDPCVARVHDVGLKDTWQGGYSFCMALKRLHVGLTIPQLKQLQKLAVKLGLDKTSTIRYCVARIAEQEGIVVKRSYDPDTVL